MFEKVKSAFATEFNLTPRNSLYDRTLLWIYISLLTIGLVAVSSASISISTKLYGDPFSMAKSDAFYILLSLCVFSFVILQPINRIEKYNVWFFFLSLILLIAVFFLGREIKGAKRWISILGFTFQASEFAKLALICYFSSFYERHYDELRKEKLSAWRPAIVVGIFIAILTGQSDFGSIIIISVITFSMLFIIGAKWAQFIVVGIVCIVGAFFYIYLSEYRMKRVRAYFDPFANVYGDGFQLANSQMAFGQGEIFGQGLGNSVQKLAYLPEAHTDFITAIIGEEFGFIGILFLLFLFVSLVIKGFKISQQSLVNNKRFKGFFAFGIAIWFLLQGVINLGGASALIPSKGLTFPFVSYGGSSMIILSIAMAILMRIDHENRLENMGYTRAKKK